MDWMSGTELLIWRRQKGIKQADLAVSIGCTRATITRAECAGDAPVSKALMAAFARMHATGAIVEATEAPARKPKLPDVLMPKHAHLRPDLKLYEKFGSLIIAAPEHPRRLLGRDKFPGPVLFSVLDSDEYKAALADYRASIGITTYATT